MASLPEMRSLMQNFEALKGLAQQVDPILERQQGLRPTDVRRVALGALQKTLAANAAIVHALYWNRSKTEVEAALSVVLSDGLSVARMVDDELRGAVVNNVHFALDALFANLTRACPQMKEERSFALNVERWFRLAGLPSVGRKVETMRAIASIRNSQHNNGIHENQSFSTPIRGTTFEFTRGQPVQCAGWGHIEIVISAALEVLDEFLASAYVVGIPFAEDRYAAAVESGQIPE